MAALMISMINVKDVDKLKDYLTKVSQLGTRHGAEMIFRGPARGVITGEQSHQMVVVVRFPSVEDIDALFSSDDYQPLIALRTDAADMTILKYEETV